jgi:hypothetical protein
MWVKMMGVRVQLKVCLAALAAIGCAVASSAHASTDITGELYFGGGSTNYYDASAGFVPSGFNNEFGNPVAVDDGTEFGFEDGHNLDAADFTGTTLSIFDLVFDDPADPGSINWTQKFTASSNGFFKGLTLVDSNFSGLSYSVSGNTLTVNWTGTEEPGFYQADFSFNGVPEPATWAMMIGGFAMAGVAMRRRRGLAAI